MAALVILGKFLEDDHWYQQLLENKRIYRVTYSGKNGQFVCFAQIRMDLDQFLFYALAPVKVPEEAKVRLAELLTRVNYGLRIGILNLILMMEKLDTKRVLILLIWSFHLS